MIASLYLSSISKFVINSWIFVGGFADAQFPPVLARKITGMILEMNTGVLMDLLDSEQHLKHMVVEALRILEAARFRGPGVDQHMPQQS